MKCGPQRDACARGARRDGYNSQLLRIFPQAIILVHGITPAFLRPLSRSLMLARLAFAVVLARWAGARRSTTLLPDAPHVSASTSSTSTRATTSRRTGRQAEGGPDQAAGPPALGTPLVAERVPRQPLGLRLRVHSARARRASTGSSPCTSSTTSSRAGKATRCRSPPPSSTGRRDAQRCRRIRTADDRARRGTAGSSTCSGRWAGGRQRRGRSASRSRAPAAAWARR